MDTVLPDPEDPAGRVVRTGANQWLLGLGGTAGHLGPFEDRGRGRPRPAGTDPGRVAAAAGVEGAGFVIRVELDTCGAWLTMACTSDLRPLVVRRAGWVDERGDTVVDRDRPWPEDRVGLGPGDAMVVVHRWSGDPGSDDTSRDVDPVAERLLDHLGTGAQGLVDAVGQPGPGTTRSGARAVAALAVPVAVAGAGPGWVAEATGVAAADLVLPGYPLGDREPERWRRPPSAPRRATFRLHRDVTRVRDLRGVLNRLISSWRLEDRVEDGTLSLLTTELATNALVHTETAATATITYLGGLVRVEVHDGSSRLPRRRRVEDEELGGRGLALIEELAVAWGSVVTPAGKRTWFDFPVGSAGGP